MWTTSASTGSPYARSIARLFTRSIARLPIMALALTLALGGAACGGDPAGGRGGEGTGGGAAGGGGAFPVTIKHKLGTTTIKSPPKRIVALGEVDQDTLLALGVPPVGMVELTGVQPDGLAPWSAPRLAGRRPTLLKSTDSGFSLEAVAALRPDLILAAGDFTIDKEYARLSRLAPTTAYQSGPAEDSWQVIARQVATAIGRPAQGARLVADVEAKINSVRRSHPRLTGKQYAFTSVFPSGNIGVMKSDQDTSVKLLNQFGMVLPEAVRRLPGEGFAAELSMEKLGILDVDVLLSHYNDDAATQRKIERNALFAGLDVVERGSYVPLPLREFWPLRTPTPLAVPYVVDQVVPKVAKAAERG
jgi:iron complex transport system substrate-binding protein